MNPRDLKAAKQLKTKVTQPTSSATVADGDDVDRQSAIASHAAALFSDESALNSFVDQISSHLGQPIGDRIAATSLLKGAKLGDAILSGDAEPGELTKAAMALVFGEIQTIGTALNSWENFSLPKSYTLPNYLPPLQLAASNSTDDLST